MTMNIDQIQTLNAQFINLLLKKNIFTFSGSISKH